MAPKKPRRNKRKSRVPRALKTFNPPSVMVKMKFIQNFSLASVAGSMVSKYFTLNSIFQPYEGSSTRQPYGQDQLAQRYKKYLVVGASLKLHTTNDIPFKMSIVADNNLALTGTNIQDLATQPKAKLVMVHSVSNHKPIVRRFTTATIAGLPKSKIISENGFAAAFGANPSEKQYLHVSAASADGVSSDTLYCLAELEYTVKCYETVYVSDT